MSTINDFIAAIEAVGGKARRGDWKQIGDTEHMVYLNVWGPLDQSGLVRDFEQVKMIVENIGVETEEAIFWGKAPKLLATAPAAPPPPEPVGTDEAILAAVATAAAGLKVLKAQIRHEAEGAMVTAVVAEVDGTFVDRYFFVVEGEGKALVAYERKAVNG